MTFPCTRCGLCCQHLELNLLYAELNRGDGVCKHYDSNLRGCSIYYARPALCRVDENYIIFAEKLSITDYYAANLQVCQALIDQFGNGHGVSVFNPLT